RRPADRLFIRSMASGGALGGLNQHVLPAVVLLRALFDRVLVETVGVGQSEAEITRVCDTTALCIQPGSGDALQFMKAGIMEVPDVIVVTKADMTKLAQRTEADVRAALSLTLPAPTLPANTPSAGNIATQTATTGNGGTWTIPIVQTAAPTGQGIADLAGKLSAHAAWLEQAGQLSRNRDQQIAHWIKGQVIDHYGSVGWQTLQRTDRHAVAALSTADEQNTPNTPFSNARHALASLTVSKRDHRDSF
ncbi:MAG: hypothetical protein AAGF32_02385, partial [Pseudomonadota bacterium]